MAKEVEEYIMIVPDYGLTSDSESVVALREACKALRLDVKIIPFPEALQECDNCDGMSEREQIESSARVLECYAQSIPECSPASLVVFGKAAMLTGMLERIPILYINPEYDKEWPWKHQFYADQKQAISYYGSALAEYQERERTARFPQLHGVPERYGVFTTEKALHKGIGEFTDRYSRNAVYEPEVGLDPEKLAQLIYRFDNGWFTLPLDEIDKALWHFPRKVHKDSIPKNLSEPLRTPLNNEICRFIKPVELEDYTVLGLGWGVPMANGQSGLKLRVKELNYMLPLERYIDRKNLNALRDAIVETRLSIECPAAKAPEVLSNLEPKSHYVTFSMPGIEREYDREFTIEPDQLRDAMIRRVFLFGGHRGIDIVKKITFKHFVLHDELRNGIAEIIHSDYPELDIKEIKRKAEISYGEDELECYLKNLARFFRLVHEGSIPQMLVAKCFEQYFDTDLYEDGLDFDDWYDENYHELFD